MGIYDHPLVLILIYMYHWWTSWHDQNSRFLTNNSRFFGCCSSEKLCTKREGVSLSFEGHSVRYPFSVEVWDKGRGVC